MKEIFGVRYYFKKVNECVYYNVMQNIIVYLHLNMYIPYYFIVHTKCARYEKIFM